MDMATRSQEHFVFHMTGHRTSPGLEPIDDSSLRPAALAAYRDLTRLRYDFPVVLVTEGVDRGTVRSLSGIVDQVVAEVAPKGVTGERLRRYALRLEREVRALAGRPDSGASPRLTDCWRRAAAAIGQSAGDADEAAEQVLAHLADALKLDGELIDCDARLPARLLTHLWTTAQAERSAAFHGTVDALIVKLTDILRAAFVHSEAGRRPDALRAALGGPHRDAFDFAVMSRLVGRGSSSDELPPRRRQRIEHALDVLRTQRFFPAPRALPGAAEPFAFAFEDCAAASRAYRERLPAIVEVVKAIALAELEADGRYVEREHDAFFATFNERTLKADDLALFPDYLVCIPPERSDAQENAGLLDLLSSGLPVKVLVETSDLVDESSIGTGHFAFGVRSARLATTAMSLGGMFVLQSAVANLYALRNELMRGLRSRSPALVSVFSGVPPVATDLPAYLSAAAAMESRAFPAFVYDAAAGTNWATRFSLANNPAPESDWCEHALEYADESLQRVRADIPFTYADFALADRRHGAHFARVPKERWNGAMLPVADWLKLDEAAGSERVPFVLAVDRDNVLHRVLVDSALMQATRRGLLLWRRLQEHAGIHDAYAERVLAQERAAWQARAQETPVPTAAIPAPAEPAPSVEEAAPAVHSPDDAWIETARCPSCGECVNINDRMFALNDDKQAFIKDIAAGTYRQLVEAAEACQVAIIHPGKPRDPNEPGIEELMERARAFA